MKKIIFLFSLLLSISIFAQKPQFLKIKKYQVGILSDSLKETSGLTLLKGKLYTFNDSGNTADLFRIEKNSGKISGLVSTQLENRDWEAITNDGNSLFIGDFGNNLGIRKDLTIYQLHFKNDEIDSLNAISFYFPEQKDFKKNNRNHDFDAESMVFIDGKVHLFTKEWVSKKTNHYIIDPQISKNQPVKKVETFDIGYLVTDASYFDKKLYLIGYTKNMEVFLSVFNEDENGFFFSQKPKKYYLGQSFTIGQIEGIAVSEDGIYISGEKFKYKIFNVPQHYYFIPKDKIPQ